MCGIAGWVDFTTDLQENIKIIEDMTDTLKERGPDSYGHYLSRHVLLGHRRLIVVDPAGGRQPMQKTVDGKTYVLVYNGELYNTEDLRVQLKAAGFGFDSYSDTEVLLCAYIHWGEACVEKLNGIFAFAVWDEAKHTVFLARDPLGVKPLFYTRRGDSFLFGSEIKTLLAHPAVEPAVDRDGLTELFALGPATAPGSGIFKGIREVPPAHALRVTPEGDALREYWKPRALPNTETEAEAADHLRTLFTDAVERQLVGDVPLCTFLSGGLDSSGITAVAAKVFAARGKVLETYSIDYQDNDKYFKASLFQPTPDEVWAERMAKAAGTRHHPYIEEHEALADALEAATVARDLPGMADIDSSLYLFCKEIRKNYVVALSGECADEIFGGYPWYTHDEMVYLDTFPWARFVGDRRVLLSPALQKLDIEGCVRQHYQQTLAQVPHLGDESKRDFRMRELFYLNIKWFMVNLLNRKDRMSMSNSLEVRVPFADYRLVEYAFNLPSALKFAGGREKGLLRLALTSLLPQEIVERKKSPYPKTHNPVYTDIVCRRMDAVLKNPDAPLAALIDRKKVREIVDTRGAAYKSPWFGQLMTGPQLLAYLLQVNYWLEHYRIRLEL